MSDPIKSPISEEVVAPYNYNKHRDETTNVALVEAFKEIAKYDKLVILTEEPTPEYKKELEQQYQDCTIALFKIFNENNVSMSEYEYLFGAMKSILSGLEGVIMDQVMGHSAKLRSVVMGAKNPGTGEYDHVYATYKDLIASVEALKDK